MHFSCGVLCKTFSALSAASLAKPVPVCRVATLACVRELALSLVRELKVDALVVCLATGVFGDLLVRWGMASVYRTCTSVYRKVFGIFGGIWWLIVACTVYSAKAW